MKIFATLLILFIYNHTLVFAKEIQLKDIQGKTCYVYLPDHIDSSKTYQVVVGVHGAGGNGNGAAGLRSWASRGDVIVLGPTFVQQGNSFYQYAGGIHDTKLLKLFKEIGKTYRVHDKMFIHGFSGGSQFAHRFAMNKPKYVCGISAHSGGTWATNGYGRISSSAKNIPFAVSCGEKDTGKSFGTAPLGRLDWYRVYEKAIERRKYCYIGKTWPGVGHGMSRGAKNMLQQCFQLATGLPGASATQKVEISPDWKNLGNIPKLSHYPDEPSDSSPVASRNSPNPKKLERILFAAFAKASEKTIEDKKLVAFLGKYPATIWKSMEGSEDLLKQCKGAADRWRAKAIDVKKFNGSIKKRFEKFSRGLDLTEANAH